MCKNYCSYGLLSGIEGCKNVLGRYAVSLRGHDRGKIYLVVGSREDGDGKPVLLLADGGKRPIAGPKAKKPKHVCVYQEKDESIASKLIGGIRVDDSEIVHSLKQLRLRP